MKTFRDSSRFQIKLGDTKEPLTTKISNEKGSIDLTGCTVRFLVVDWQRKNILIDDVATIEYASEGIVSYSFKDGQINKIGSYLCEFEIEFPNGKKEIFPTIGEIILTINPSLRGVIIVPPIDNNQALDGGNFATIVFEKTIDGGSFSIESNNVIDGGGF